MSRSVPIEIGGWYHCFNRGVDRRRVFASNADYERFMVHIFLSCCKKSTQPSNIRNVALRKVLSSKSIRTGSPLVELGACCLMPDHVHFVVGEVSEGGIAVFMHKVFTGYTMYFGGRDERAGALFAGACRAKHLSTDRYFGHAINYVHMNPVELYEPGWKTGSGNLGAVEEKLRAYKYSSLLDHTSAERPENKILGSEVFQLFSSPASVSTMLFDAQAYYREITSENIL